MTDVPTIDVSETLEQREFKVESIRNADGRFAFNLYPIVIRSPRILLPNWFRQFKMFHESVDAGAPCIITNTIETSAYGIKWNHFTTIPLHTPCTIVCMWYNNHTFPDSFRLYADNQRDQGYVVSTRTPRPYGYVIVMKEDIEPLETILKQEWRWKN